MISATVMVTICTGVRIAALLPTSQGSSLCMAAALKSMVLPEPAGYRSTEAGIFCLVSTARSFAGRPQCLHAIYCALNMQRSRHVPYLSPFPHPSHFLLLLLDRSLRFFRVLPLFGRTLGVGNGWSGRPCFASCLFERATDKHREEHLASHDENTDAAKYFARRYSSNFDDRGRCV